MKTVYTFPNGFAKQAGQSYLSLLFSGLNPQWGEIVNDVRTIELEESDCNILLLMAEQNPAKWGSVKDIQETISLYTA